MAQRAQELNEIQTDLSEEVTWQELREKGLRAAENKGLNSGLSKGAVILIGYLEDTQRKCFKSKHVNDYTNAGISAVKIGRNAPQIKKDLEISDEEYLDWYWGSKDSGTYIAEKMRESISEHSDYSFDWE